MLPVCISYRLTPVFHHDSPYDACSPQFNRGTRTAPVRAFDRSVDPVTKALLESHQQREGGMPDAEDPSREQLHELSEISANQDDMGISGYADPNTAQGELMGTGTEPWQEFLNSSPYQQKSTTPSPLSQPQEFGDMESILRGGRRRADNASSRNEGLDAPSETYDIMSVSRKDNPAIGRSKSLMGRLRRLKLDPVEASMPESTARSTAVGSRRENQIRHVPQAAAPLSSSIAPTTVTLPTDSAGASAGQTGPGVFPLQPEATPATSQRAMAPTFTPPRASDAPPPLPPKVSVQQESSAAMQQRSSMGERRASDSREKQNEMPSRGGGLFRRFTTQHRRPSRG